MKFSTAGESHGPGLSGIIEGLPSGLLIDTKIIDKNLKLRQSFPGRSSRMSLEEDKVRITSGLYKKKTTGSPLAIWIENKSKKEVSFFVPRPGHADLPGYIKYSLDELHLPAERASGRNTALLVAAGTIAKFLLDKAGIKAVGYVENIGGIQAQPGRFKIERKCKILKKSRLRCLDEVAEEQMIKKISLARNKGDTLGGIAAIEIEGMPLGIGSYINLESSLDGRYAQMLMGIPSVRGIQIGDSFNLCQKFGSQVQDILKFKNKKIEFVPNYSAGILAGMTTGQTIYIRLAIKPVPTLREGVLSFNIKTKKIDMTPALRADTCVVSSVSLIAECAASWVTADALTEKFPSDTLEEFMESIERYKQRCMKKLK